MPPTAFVAGASGYTGRAVVEAWRRHGGQAVAHLRPGSPALERLGPELEARGVTVDTTPWDAAALTATLRRVRPGVVFSLLGTTRSRARREGMDAAAAYERVDYGLTALLIEATAATGLRPRFVYLSSLGAGRPGGTLYLRARTKAEAKLRDSGLPYTIVRPSFISGPDREEDRPLERAAALAVDAGLAVLGVMGGRRLRARYRSRTAAELAASLVALAGDPAAEDRTLESEGIPEPPSAGKTR